MEKADVWVAGSCLDKEGLGIQMPTAFLEHTQDQPALRGQAPARCMKRIA